MTGYPPRSPWLFLVAAALCMPWISLPAHADDAAAAAPAGEQTPAATGDSPTVAQKTDAFFTAPSFGKDALVLGGYLQFGYKHIMNTQFNPDDEDGFAFQNARLTGWGKYDFVSWFGLGYKFNFDVADGAFKVKDIMGSLRFFSDRLVLDVGQFKVPYTALELVSEAETQWVAGPPLAKLTYGRDRGIQLRGSLDVGGGVWMAYWAGVFNGEGPNTLSNSDSNYLYALRYEIGPLGAVSAGEPDLDNSPIRFALGGSFAYTSSIGRKDLSIKDAHGSELRYSVDLRLKFKGLSVRAEYMAASVDRKGTPAAGSGDSDTFGRYGIVAQAGYVLPIPKLTWPKFEVVFRYSQMDVNDAEDGWTQSASGKWDYSVWDDSAVRYIDLGMNAYVVGHKAKLGFLYRFTDFLEGPKTDVNGDVLIGDMAMIILQIGWL